MILKLASRNFCLDRSMSHCEGPLYFCSLYCTIGRPWKALMHSHLEVIPIYLKRCKQETEFRYDYATILRLWPLLLVVSWLNSQCSNKDPELKPCHDNELITKKSRLGFNSPNADTHCTSVSESPAFCTWCSYLDAVTVDAFHHSGTTVM